MSRIFNFNAGPAALPLEVLEEVQAELLDFNNTGMSILEISHRSPAFEKVLEETKQDIKDLLNLPDDYGIFFMGGGGSLQFSCVPCNFLKEGMRRRQPAVQLRALQLFERRDDGGVFRHRFFL